MAEAPCGGSGARLRLAGGCATAGGGDYLRLGRLFFTISTDDDEEASGGDGGAIERIVSAGRHAPGGHPTDRLRRVA